MNNELKLSALDQSPVKTGSNPAAALQETIELASLCDQLGYHRYWVSEHHASDALAGCSPEVLLGRLGAETTQIRLGSGGIMLPYYSPYKVAENFKNSADAVSRPNGSRGGPSAWDRSIYRLRNSIRLTSRRGTLSEYGRRPAGTAQ